MFVDKKIPLVVVCCSPIGMQNLCHTENRMHFSRRLMCHSKVRHVEIFDFIFI